MAHIHSRSAYVYLSLLARAMLTTTFTSLRPCTSPFYASHMHGLMYRNLVQQRKRPEQLDDLLVRYPSLLHVYSALTSSTG